MYGNGKNWIGGISAVALIAVFAWGIRGCTRTSAVTQSGIPPYMGAQLAPGTSVAQAAAEPSPAATPPSAQMGDKPVKKVIVDKKEKTPVMEYEDRSQMNVAPNDSYVSVEGGLAFGAPSVEPHVENTCCRAGLLAGIGLESELDEELSIVTGVRYAQRGGRAILNGSEVDVAIDYLEVPLLAKLRLQASPTFVPYVIGGAVLGFKTRAVGRSAGVSTDLGSRVSNLDVGLSVGFGADVAISGPWSFFLSNRYSISFIDIDKTSGRWSSRAVEFLGGLRYRLP